MRVKSFGQRAVLNWHSALALVLPDKAVAGRALSARIIFKLIANEAGTLKHFVEVVTFVAQGDRHVIDQVLRRQATQCKIRRVCDSADNHVHVPLREYAFQAAKNDVLDRESLRLVDRECLNNGCVEKHVPAMAASKTRTG